MSYEVKVTLPDKQERLYAGVDGVFFVNPGTHGHPLSLFERDGESVNTGEEILFLNTAELLAARIKEL